MGTARVDRLDPIVLETTALADLKRLIRVRGDKHPSDRSFFSLLQAAGEPVVLLRKLQRSNE